MPQSNSLPQQSAHKWAKIVVTLERAVNSDDAHKYLQEYSIRLGPGDDGTAATEQRGVMVIKSKSKTRAKQRKGAVMNWKRVGKVTIKELHKRNMTGEQLRRLMWERASISTPVRVTSPDLLDGDMNTGFGGLAAALDVMAFTNDISLPTSTAGPTVPNGGVTPTAPAAQVPNGGIAPTAPTAPVSNGGPPQMGWQAPTDAGGKPVGPAPMGWQKPTDSGQAGALFSSLSSSLAGTDPPPAYPPPQPPPPRYDALDPDAFRQLVLAADALEPGALVDLARRAALVDELTLVSPRKQHEYCCRGMVETRQKQLSVDQSESDTLGDGPVLGKGSRLRRARSARQRNVASAPTAPPLDQYARYHHDHNNNQRSSSSENEETISITVATPKTQLLPNGNVKANGLAGKRLESATMNREIIPKGSGKPRPKTARNRVAPQEGGHTRRVTSAAPTPTPAVAPDPLDAWSTKDIANINSLLDDGDDSM